MDDRELEQPTSSDEDDYTVMFETLTSRFKSKICLNAKLKPKSKPPGFCQSCGGDSQALSHSFGCTTLGRGSLSAKCQIFGGIRREFWF
jgi:hypothetical protein